MTPALSSDQGVTLIGGGAVNPVHLAQALALAPVVAAADAGADAALANGVTPQAVIGDLDSISHDARLALGDRLHRVAEQDTTDFEKCLLRLAAPFVIAVGFSGPRMDHALAALNTLGRRVGPPTVLLTEADAVLACPPTLTADLPIGTRLSLFPLAKVKARSEGLEWPLDTVAFDPAGEIAASNKVTGPLAIQANGPLLMILPIEHLTTAIQIARQ